jgi:hypothetical protein
MPARRSGAEEPTLEQEAAVAAFVAGHHVVLQAGAGSGKTTTLTMLAAGTRRWGRYLAFNSAIAREARTRFPSNVDCRTAHSLAFRAVGRDYEDRLRAPRMSSAKLAAMLGINLEVRLGQRKVTAVGLAYAAQETVIRYCQSADPLIGPQHVPWLKGIGEEYLHDQLAEVVLPYAQRMWADLQNPDGGKVKFKHDHVFNTQRGHAQLVMVGDSGQAIYGWRGARDVMTGFDGVALTLSHSFRFGERIAQEANRWLAIAHAPIRITGSPSLDSGLDKVERPDAILCRTNGGAMAEILTLLDLGRRVALVGRGDTLSDLALAARDLKSGRRTSHPELLLFSTWGEVQDYAEYDPDGRDLQPFVDVIDEHGVDVVLDVISRLCDETGADVTVSTVHKAKGREWPTVRIANDFIEPEDPDQEVDTTGEPLPGPIDPAEARLGLRRRHPRPPPARPRRPILDQPTPQRKPRPTDPIRSRLSGRVGLNRTEPPSITSIWH